MQRRVLGRFGYGIIIAAGLAIAAGVGALVHAAPDQAGATVRVSVNTLGSQGDDSSFVGGVSANGRFVAFTSRASLVADDTNPGSDVLVRDRDADGNGVFDETGKMATIRVNVSSAGEQANVPESDQGVAINADGRFVAFASGASNLVTDDHNGLTDIFVRDRDADGNGLFDEPAGVATVRVSLSSAGAEPTSRFGCFSAEPKLNASGRFVAFTSTCPNLVADKTSDFFQDVFVRDRDTDGNGRYDEPGAVSTVRVSVSTAGEEANATSQQISISADGRHVAFLSLASNLVSGDTNGLADVFVRDRDTDGNGIFDEPGGVRTVRVSLDESGNQRIYSMNEPIISPNGRFVAYHAHLDALPLGTQAIFIYDRDADGNGIFDEPGGVSTHQVAIAIGGGRNDADASPGSFSADGRLFAFTSDLPLDGSDTNGAVDVFVLDRDADGNGVFDEPGSTTTTRVSVPSGGGLSSRGGISPAMSADGRAVAFNSVSADLVLGDTNGVGDVFLHDRLRHDEGPFEDASCRDGVDNDGDGLADAADPDCAPPAPEGRFGSATCSDGIDNDRNGLIDGDDPSCAPFEGPVGDATCSDGIDNDGDGLVDLADPGCHPPPTPEGPRGDASCADGVDNDGDGLVDLDDPDCWAAVTVLDLGTLGGNYSAATGINDLGQVVGMSRDADGRQRAFLWQPGSLMQDLGTIVGGPNAEANGVNNRGQVAGTSAYDPFVGDLRAFLWQAGTGLTDIGALPGNRSEGVAINDLGQIVGSSLIFPARVAPTHAALWQPGLGWLDLGKLGAFDEGRAQGLNNRGQVVGVAGPFGNDTTVNGFAFYWDARAGMTPIPALTGGLYNNAFAINDVGQAVGWSEFSGRTGTGRDGSPLPPTGGGLHHAFVWDLAGGLVDLGLGEAFGINNSGQVVGASADGVARPYLWQNGVAIDLNGRVGGTGQARAINNALRRQVAGHGIAASGETHAMIWTLADPAVIARNRAPSANAGGPYSGLEGSPIAFDGSASSDPDGDRLTYTWYFGDGSVAYGRTATNTYADSGDYAGTLVVSDGVADASALFSVHVENVVPVVQLPPEATLIAGEWYTALGTFVDPGADTWTATVDYGGGGGAQPLFLVQKTFAVSHFYAAPGTFIVTTRVADDDSAPGVAGVAQAIVTVQSLQQALLALAGSLNTPLAVKLQAAAHQLDLNHPDTAANQINAFVNEVNGLAGAGQMAGDVAARLLAAVERILGHMQPAGNVAPACFGPSEAIVAPLFTSVQLSASVCSDPEGQPLQYAWTVDQSPAGVERTVLQGADTANASLFLNVPTTAATPYVIRVTVTDTAGQTASWTFTIYTSATP
jgi:probable HAF family extracellular repeat protein